MSAISIREQIIRAAEAAVNNGTPAGVPICVRTAMQPSEQDQLPAMTVFPFRQTTNNKATGRWGDIVTHDLYLRFVVYGAGDPADGVLDPILVWLTKTLAGQQFGGLANDTVEHEINWQYDEGTFQVAAAAVDFRVEYQTLRADATQTQ
ncbi:hypothetical protein R77567_01617 [Ralstonia sp. LMG 32965]|uniref:Uncharacterized protein n=1 Tax=Ralstonia flatus TaxID=3058601 RepID=A0AAD2BZZ1_9RALS|nr:hypothetical protein [Ralstonia sp. LMG 32965]MBN6211431.1 hypothetical protein [Ralstonia pickettii]CAJ0862102.1 hypothetical protein R77567_01617 [Ralstonia sp. LMG 32965]